MHTTWYGMIQKKQWGAANYIASSVKALTNVKHNGRRRVINSRGLSNQRSDRKNKNPHEALRNKRLSYHPTHPPLQESLSSCTHILVYKSLGIRVE